MGQVWPSCKKQCKNISEPFLQGGYVEGGMKNHIFDQCVSLCLQNDTRCGRSYNRNK